jgi:hypothetical protein
MYLKPVATQDARPVLPAALTRLIAPRGMAATTRVETAAGWRPAAEIQAGDLVHTWDGGLRPVREVERQSRPAGTEMVRLPGGILGLCDAIDLAPDQEVAIESRGSGRVHRVRAAALAGLSGACVLATTARHEMILPVFDEEELVWVNSGLRLFCPARSGAEGIAALRTGPNGRSQLIVA